VGSRNSVLDTVDTRLGDLVGRIVRAHHERLWQSRRSSGSPTPRRVSCARLAPSLSAVRNACGARSVEGRWTG
jgi:hypothetical protein